MKKKFQNLNLKNELTKAEMKAVVGGVSCSGGGTFAAGCGYCESTGRGTSIGCGSNPPGGGGGCQSNSGTTVCSNGWSYYSSLGCGYCEGTGRGTTIKG